MRQPWKFLVIVSVVLAVTLSFCNAQTVDPLVSSVCLKDGDIGENSYVWGERELEIAFPGENKEWPFLTHHAIIESPDPPNEGLLSFTVTYGHFSDRSDLEEAWKAISYTNHSSADLGTDPEYSAFNVAKGTPPTYLRFIKNGFIVEISVGPSRDLSKLDFVERESYFRLVRDKIINNIENLQTPPVTEFELEIEKSSSNYPFEIIGTVVGTTEYKYYVVLNDLQEGEEVEVQHTSTGERTFAIQINALQPGQYQLLIVVTDSLDRIKRFSEEVIVAGPSESSFPTIKDTILSLRNQHQNDGANKLLTLEKIQGKATRSAVAFDLANTNLNGLSKATLVFNVDANEHVQGWGNGRTISAQTITTPWVEGNGMNFGLKKKDQVSGNGSGATWFSPIDENISNDSSNSAVNWNGAGVSVSPPTAPSVTIPNGLSGEVAFDVTADVLNGADNGWLILKDQENVGSKISFYSREGAAAAGNPVLAPRLILEFGEVASSEPSSDSLLANAGFGTIGTKLRLTSDGSEVRSTKEVLQENLMAALAVEQILAEATRTNPVLNLTTRVAYRSWLAEGLQIAVTPFWAA